MKRRTVALGLACLPLALLGCASSPPPRSSDLINNLTGLLGITENQAMGGVGSVLTLAQGKLSASDFDKVASTIPGADKYIDMAKSLGAVSGPLGNFSDLMSSYTRLGIPPQSSAKFGPAVADYVGKTDSSAGALLSGVLM